MNSGTEALVAHLKLQIEKLRRELYGTRSERAARLLDQLEMQLEDAEAALSEDELAAEEAAAKTATVTSFERRRRGGRKPFPEHLPRERVVVPGSIACACCGSDTGPLVSATTSTGRKRGSTAGDGIVARSGA